MSKLFNVMFFVALIGFVGCQKVDLTPVTTKIDELAKRIDTIENAIQPLLTPDTTKTNITPQLKMELDKITKEIAGVKKQLQELTTKYDEHIKKYHSGTIK